MKCRNRKSNDINGNVENIKSGRTSKYIYVYIFVTQDFCLGEERKINVVNHMHLAVILYVRRYFISNRNAKEKKTLKTKRFTFSHISL